MIVIYHKLAKRVLSFIPVGRVAGCHDLFLL